MANVTVLSHGRGWLRADAAAAVARIDAALGRPLDINSAGRTLAEQQALIARWDAGGVYNRPPYLYAPARPASVSPHVKDGGVALDTDDQSWMLAHGASYGFLHDVPSDKPHFVYHADKDPFNGGTTIASNENTTKDRQNFVNVHRGESLVVDGKEGPKTKAAYGRYQTFLRNFGYVGAIDGIWGTGTQAAHAAYYATLVPTAQPAPELGGQNPFGLADVTGLQKVAKMYGYTGPIDNIWGAGSAGGFSQFLKRNWKGSLARWLRAKYQYVGNDVYGPNMRAALARANAANKAAL